mmetsp:Transcript_35488/g.56775  ORF Transcript_35488/g.56775 Transcript_35488/m.56775 type:complete len:106 (+) Transcript_35488:1884-2201(+)
MQPQGHVLLVTNLHDFGMDPQAAIDAPRFCIKDGTSNGEVAIEEGIEEHVIEKLVKAGHRILKGGVVRGFDRSVFGRSQIITRNRETGVLCGGSDGRADGLAIGY